MVLYNTLMGLCAGTGLIIFGKDVKRATSGQTILLTDGVMYLVLGLPLFALSLHMALTWPLTVNPPINIAFAEPGLIFGSLMIFAGVVIVSASMGRSMTIEYSKPSSIAIVIFAVGLMMLSTSTAIFSYNLVGDAPPQEPITGQFTGWENTFFGLLYLLVAIGCLLAPLIFKLKYISIVMYWCFTISGIVFLLFSVLNYRTHIGLLINLEQGTNYRW